MEWLDRICYEINKRKPEGEILVESGISPSGTYHLGYLREIITCDAITLSLQEAGRGARHIHFVDDQDGFRKLPKNVPASYEKYLGQPLWQMPAPDKSKETYADYALKPFLASVSSLGVQMDVIRSHEKYAEGFFVPAIELVLENLASARQVLEEISGRKLGEEWSPIQVDEEGYLKKRPFVAIDTANKKITYLDKESKQQVIGYKKGQVKLDWRLDWPARWWLLKVDIEPFGRDHATKGGSYDTGQALMDEIFKSPAPLPVPYEFVNRAGESKKMSASEGDGIDLSEAVHVLPPEVLRYFILRSSPDRTLYFDPVGGVVRLIDEFAELLARESKSEAEQKLIKLCIHNIEPTVSNIPFSHLVSSYQAALKDSAKTIEIIMRTEHKHTAEAQQELIEKELKFINRWLEAWAPDEVKFDLLKKVPSNLSVSEQNFLKSLAAEVSKAPDNADGEWFHKSIYDLKGLEPQEKFVAIYKSIIGKEQGPRAGWFLSILPRDWLVKRLNLET